MYANEMTGRVMPDTTALAATYDKAGNLRTQEIGDGSVEVVYTWDGWNRLVKVEYDSDTRAEYDYNGLNWRIAKRADMASPPEGAPTQERLMYYSAQWQLVEERIIDDLQVLTVPEVNRHMQYVWGTRYIDDIIMRRQNRNLDNDSPDITYEDVWYHLTDALFSTVAVINAAAVVVERVSYSPYGAAQHHSNADINGDGSVDTLDQLILLGAWGSSTLADLNRSGAVDVQDLLVMNNDWGPGAPSGQLSLRGGTGGGVTDNILGFAGYIFNAEFHGAGLYTVRHRHYDPELGRWLSRDPLGYVDGMGLYEYVGGNSVVRVDPMGQKWDCIVCASCAGAAAISCAILCADGKGWDTKQDNYGECFMKCLAAVPGASPIVDIACVTACASCVGKKLTPKPKPQPKPQKPNQGPKRKQGKENDRFCNWCEGIHKSYEVACKVRCPSGLPCAAYDALTKALETCVRNRELYFLSGCQAKCYEGTPDHSGQIEQQKTRLQRCYGYQLAACRKESLPSATCR